MERERKINWLSLFIKMIIIFIFILIIIWLVSKINGKTKLSDTFKNNITNMETVATNYYKEVDLPLEKGKKLKITLGEMIEKGLIVSVNDKEGVSCDTSKSFSKITRKKSDYILETTLKCGKEQDTITKKFPLKDCQNCNKKEEQKENKEVLNNSNNTDIVEKENNSNSNNKQVGITYYEYFKETKTYSKWAKGNITGNNVENKYEYYGIAKDTYYSIGVIEESDFKVGNTITYTLKLNKVPNKNYYFTKIEDSAYYNTDDELNYLKEKKVELNNSKYSIYNNIDTYSLLSSNFNYKLSPYYRKGSFYIDVEITITNTNGVNYYEDGNINVYFVPLKIDVKFISNNITETKPNGDYETINYYRYVETNIETIWSSETYIEGYTKTGNTEIR